MTNKTKGNIMKFILLALIFSSSTGFSCGKKKPHQSPSPPVTVTASATPSPSPTSPSPSVVPSLSPSSLPNPSPSRTSSDIIGPGEACHGTNLNGYNCMNYAAGYIGGQLKCRSDNIGFDFSGCTPGEVIKVFNVAKKTSTGVIEPSCDAIDVQSAVSSAENADKEGFTILLPPYDGDTKIYNCDFTKSAVKSGIYSYQTRTSTSRNIIIQGGGIDKTIVKHGGTAYAFSFYVQAGKPARITGLTMDGTSTPVNTALIGFSGPNGALKGPDGTKTYFRVDHTHLMNITQRGISASSIYGLIDNNKLERIPSGYSPTLISLNGDITLRTLNPQDVWTRPQDLGTPASVYMEDNTFIHPINSNGPYDAYEGARYVFRFNKVYGNNLGHHGFDSSARGTMNFEIYNNYFRNSHPVTNAPFVHGVVFEFRSGTGVVFNNTVERATTSTNMGGFYNAFVMLRNYRSDDGYLTNYGYPFPWNGVNPANGVCDGTDNPVTHKPKGFDGPLETMGYPCRDQIGRTTNQTLSPLHAWNNSFQGISGPPVKGGNMAVYGYAPPPLGGVDRVFRHVQEFRDYRNGVCKPGYVQYPYPHPLAGVVPLPQSLNCSTP